MELTWHGHSTWHVSVDDTSLLIDPFFGNPFTVITYLYCYAIVLGLV